MTNLDSKFMRAVRKNAKEDYAGRPTFSIVNQRSGALLGNIGWHDPWRCFCFSPLGGVTIFNGDCLDSLAKYCKDLTAEFRARKGGA